MSVPQTTTAPRTSMCLGGIFPCLTSLDMTMASSPFRVSSVPDGCFCSAWPHHSVFRPYIKCAFSQHSNMHDSVSESAGKVMGFRPRSAIVDQNVRVWNMAFDSTPSVPSITTRCF